MKMNCSFLWKIWKNSVRSLNAARYIGTYTKYGGYHQTLTLPNYNNSLNPYCHSKKVQHTLSLKKFHLITRVPIGYYSITWDLFCSNTLKNLNITDLQIILLCSLVFLLLGKVTLYTKRPCRDLHPNSP